LAAGWRPVSECADFTADNLGVGWAWIVTTAEAVDGWWWYVSLSDEHGVLDWTDPEWHENNDGGSVRSRSQARCLKN